MKCPSLTSVNSGGFSLHSVEAYGHLGLKRQPAGGVIGLGTSPLKPALMFLTFGSGIGTASINA